jgi:hypothetical protein
MVIDYSDAIFENYDMFLKENNSQMATPAGAIEMLSSDGSFRAYMESLTDSLPPVTKAVVMGVAQREREMLLEESVNFGPSGAAIGYNVTYFPILADIYSDPVISQLATTYPVGKSLITIPKVKVRGTVTNTDGSTSTWLMPRDTNLIRSSAQLVTLSPAISNNLFTIANVTADDVNVNKRYFIITAVNLQDGVGNQYNVPVSIRPDARGQLSLKFTFTDTVNHIDGGSVHPIVTGSLIGNVDWNSGVVQYSISFANPAGAHGVFTAVSAVASLVFSPRKSDIGRVKVSLDIQGWDVNIDVKDDFEVELQTETIDDYKDIYNIDLIRTLSLAMDL